MKQRYYTGGLIPYVDIVDGIITDTIKSHLSASEIEYIKSNPDKRILFRRW